MFVRELFMLFPSYKQKGLPDMYIPGRPFTVDSVKKERSTP